ncbi:hypothetical protein PENSPDRAFT_648630 [Peniophora sp. CONT]|nr:hypothetical protein PENSPDRAFT_648630 [Peniophora sp. CONT]
MQNVSVLQLGLSRVKRGVVGWAWLALLARSQCCCREVTQTASAGETLRGPLLDERRGRHVGLQDLRVQDSLLRMAWMMCGGSNDVSSRTS